jgi:hypothetical protein
MRTPAKILLAGTFAAILPCAPATSQTLPATVDNEQVQYGDVFSGQQLDVVEASDGIIATTTATGNSADFTTEGVDLDVRSNQTLQANVDAQTEVNVSGFVGDSSVLTTAATGNAGDGGVVDGTHTGVYNQVTEAVGITASSRLQAGTADAGDISSSVQAIGNSQGLFQVGDVTYTYGQSDFTATAAANNVTITGGGSGQRVDVSQSSLGERAQASVQTSYDNAWLTNSQATATGNNITATEESPVLDLTARQENLAYLRAESVNYANQFGAGTAIAYGVGNSVVAGNAGQEVTIDNTQYNDTGGVDAYAEYSGDAGYDSTASATAMGNAASGYACSDCASGMTVSNSQTNGANVRAEARTSVGSGRTVVGVANAVGNTASYYVSRPSE